MSNGSHSEAAKGFVDKAGAGAKTLCPQCGGDRPRRLERKGFLQTRIYPLFGYYPWMCMDCKAVFLARKRYRRKSKRKEEYVSREQGKKQD